jgi:hypothetical protein
VGEAAKFCLVSISFHDGRAHKSQFVSLAS